MTKPHEETWAAKPENDEPDPVWMVVGPDRTVMADSVEENHAKLIVQAPAMARLLLKLAGQFGESDDGYRRCASCGGEAHAVHTVPHHATCELAAVLRAAGVLP